MHDPAPLIDRLRRVAPELVVALGALLLNAWSLSVNGYSNTYYAAAARSMTTSWHNFIYGSYDVGGFITTDKPPFALWLQAASARVFGYNSWSLLMPSAIAGALAVWLLMLTVRRVWGRTAGLVAGVAFMLTPMVWAVSRSMNPDAVLMFTLVSAAWATERAVQTNQARWSAIAGLVVGSGFLAKMLAAVVVAPALVAALVLGISTSWRRNAAHVGLFTAMFVAVSGAWVALMDLSANSPFVGGSEDGSAWNLVFGYNGFGRVFGNEGPGSGSGGPGGGIPAGGGGGPGGLFGSSGGVDQFGGSTGIGRLFNMGMGDQVMWLSALAGAALIAAAITAARRRRRDAETASLLTFGLWAVTAYGLFAFSSGIFHNYYVSALAPAIAGLVGAGVGQVLRGGRPAKLVAAFAMLATAAVELAFLRRVDEFEWLRTVTPVALVIAAIALAVWAFRPELSRWRYLTIGWGLAAAVLAPAMWIATNLDRPQSTTFPDARPASVSTGFGGGAGPGGASGTDNAGPGGFGGGIGTTVLDYLESTRTTETWVLAVSSSMQASTAVIDGYDVLAMGGFSGGDSAMSAERLAELVRAGELRYVSGDGGFGGGGGFGGPGGGGGTGVTAWVSTACTQVTAEQVGSAVIYDCQGEADAILDAAKNTATDATTGPGGLPAQPGDGNGATPPANGGQQGGNPPLGSDLEALQQCFTENGVDASQLQNGPPDFNDPTVAAAMTACARYLPGGGSGGSPGGAPPIGSGGGGLPTPSTTTDP